jgi:hypothetical protein
MMLAWIGVLLVSKEWKIQPLYHDFKPEITKASICLLFAVMVLASMATACSARLGQVMTLVVCAGVFVLGLMSNHLIGSRAIDNTFIAQIDKATPKQDGMKQFTQPEDTYDFVLSLEPRVRMPAGMPVYYGEFPSGYDLAVKPFTAFAGDVNNPATISDRTQPPSIAVLAQKGRALTIVRTGPAGDLAVRPPQAGDYLFSKPTKYNYAAWGVWSLVPNVQLFWLLDAVSQAAPIPMGHVFLVLLYALAQVGVFVSLAVVLFQTREVG